MMRSTGWLTLYSPWWGLPLRSAVAPLVLLLVADQPLVDPLQNLVSFFEGDITLEVVVGDRPAGLQVLVQLVNLGLDPLQRLQRRVGGELSAEAVLDVGDHLADVVVVVVHGGVLVFGVDHVVVAVFHAVGADHLVVVHLRGSIPVVRVLDETVRAAVRGLQVAQGAEANPLVVLVAALADDVRSAVLQVDGEAAFDLDALTDAALVLDREAGTFVLGHPDEAESAGLVGLGVERRVRIRRVNHVAS